MADPNDLYGDEESPPIVEPTYDEAPAAVEPDDAQAAEPATDTLGATEPDDSHPLLALLHKHFPPDSAFSKFFHELHDMMQGQPGTDFWRGG